MALVGALGACGAMPASSDGATDALAAETESTDGATPHDAPFTETAPPDGGTSDTAPADAPAADAPAGDSGPLPSTDPFQCTNVIAEIDTATTMPEVESPAGSSRVETLLGRPARSMAPGSTATAMAFRIGAGRGLQAGHAYLLDVEYPDDVPRTIFVGNRGSDLERGFATGTATGDARRAYSQPALESYDYPQTHAWQHWTQMFVLGEHFHTLRVTRDPTPGSRPDTPASGFLVVIFQGKLADDPRARGAAVGRIRLCDVPDVRALYAPLPTIPAGLPRRRVFWREEMGDEPIGGAMAADRAVTNTADFYVYKMQMARALGYNAFGRDLLEFGFDEGWDSGDGNWVNNAQPPNTDLWSGIMARVAEFGLDVMPYYEYKGSIGSGAASLGTQHRAQKLYHGMHSTCGSTEAYTCTSWAEGSNADLTDPDTLTDIERVIDRTITRFRTQAQFAGMWLRTRQTHLPVSFSDAAIGRFRAAFPGDARAQSANQSTLIASYQGDHVLYDQYIAWWLDRRAAFLSSVREYARSHSGTDDFQVLYTTSIYEGVVPLMVPDQSAPVGVVTDDAAWWQSYAPTVTDSWYRWSWGAFTLDQVVAMNLYGRSIDARPHISIADAFAGEDWHSAPGPDPERYRTLDGVAMTFPAGRLFAVADPALLDRFRARSGLTVVHHDTLNEDNTPTPGPSNLPYDGRVGYASITIERAGPFVALENARALANGDPRNIAYLEPSGMSTGFPREVRRFHQAFTAVPALPSTRLTGASDQPDVVVREVRTPSQGTYYYVVNTAFVARTANVHLPATGAGVDLVSGAAIASMFAVTLDPGEVRAIRVGGT